MYVLSTLKFVPIMLLSIVQKVAHYSQYYAHNHCNYAIVHIIFLMTRLAYKAQTVILYFYQ